MDAELYELLTELGRLHYLVLCYQEDKDGPEVVAAVRNRGEVADVLILHSDIFAYAFRTPRQTARDSTRRDLLYPDEVLWDKADTPVATLKALLELPAPNTTGAPTRSYPAQLDLCLPSQRRGTSVRIRVRET